MESKDMKFLNTWDKKRKHGRFAYIFLNGILYPSVGIILWLIIGWRFGIYYLQNQIIWQRMIYGSVPICTALIIVFIFSSLKRFDENERRYLSYLARYKFKE